MTKSTFITFYAYKGGTGRTTALAHTALCLAHSGHRVVAIDLDLAAPSLWPLLGGNCASQPTTGMVDAIDSWLHGRPLNILEHIQEIPLDSRATGSLFVLSAGLMDAHYLRILESLDWSHLANISLGAEQTELFPRQNFFDALRDELESISATVILFDAPTGLNDTANVCLRLASDIVILIFAANSVQLEGIARVVSALTEEQGVHMKKEDPLRPDIYSVVSTVMSQRPSGALYRRIQQSFDYLAKVRYQAMGSPELTEELASRIEQTPAVIGYDVALSELEKIDTTSPIDHLRGPYEDIVEFLDTQLPTPTSGPSVPRPTITRERKYGLLDDLTPRMEIFADRSESNPTSFLRASHLAEVGEARVVVILGGKGAGKTELFNYCTTEEPQHAKHHVAVHGDVRSSLSSDALVHLMSACPPDIVWRAYCLAQLPKALQEMQNETVHQAISTLDRLRTSSSGIQETVELLNTRGLDIGLHAAWRELDSSLDPGETIALYIDGLDTAFKDDLEIRTRSLQCLFVGWQATFAGLQNIHLKVFLRSDLWDSLNFPEKSHLQTRTLRLAWDELNLWRIVLKRTLQSQEFRGICSEAAVDPVLSADQVERAPAELLHSHLEVLFEKRIWSGKNSLTRNWVMRRLADAKNTVFPRDVLCLMREALKRENERIQESKRVSADTILSREAVTDALVPTSELRVQAVLEEYRELETVFPLLRGKSAKGQISELRSALGREPDRHIELLVKAGVLEFRGEDYTVPPLYLHGLGMTRLGPR